MKKVLYYLACAAVLAVLLVLFSTALTLIFDEVPVLAMFLMAGAALGILRAVSPWLKRKMGL